MQLMYVDESGDPGPYNGANSPHFILSGLIVDQNDWNACFGRYKEFRSYLKSKYDLPLRVELHASELIRVGSIEEYRKIRKSDRLAILKYSMQQLPSIFPNAKVLNICLKKSDFENGQENVQITAWKRLIQRYDTYLKKSAKDYGILICDNTDEVLVRGLLRKMRVYNPIPSYYGGTYTALTDNILDDVFLRESKHSYFVQVADIIAHSLYRKEYPKGSLKKFNVETYFNFIGSLLLKEASRSDEQGIVRG